MVKSWVIEKFGGSDGLRMVDLGIPTLGPSDVLIKHKAIGLNKVDLLQQRGVYPITENKVVGCEVVGVVEDLGKDVVEFRKGDRVAYATVLGGACAEYNVVDRSCVVPVPNYISDSDAAALLRKGMLAHALLRRTFFVNKDIVVLVNNAATGLGRLICVLAKHYGAKVIATCDGQLQYESVKSLEINLIINIKDHKFTDKVLEFTKSKGANVIYDFSGSRTFDDSLECIAFFGLLVNLEDSYGAESNFDLNKLFSRSAFVTSPSLDVYKHVRQELLLSSNEVFALAQKKVINPDISRYKFTDVKQAYSDLAEGKILGQGVIEL